MRAEPFEVVFVFLLKREIYRRLVATAVWVMMLGTVLLANPAKLVSAVGTTYVVAAIEALNPHTAFGASLCSIGEELACDLVALDSPIPKNCAFCRRVRFGAVAGEAKSVFTQTGAWCKFVGGYCKLLLVVHDD